VPLFDQTHPGTQIVDAIDQQRDSIGEVYREKYVLPDTFALR